jgi:deoxycytidylate deaminase
MLHYFIEQALLEAQKSPVSSKYGAVLVNRNKIIARGHNKHSGNIGTLSKYCLL